ncbi:MAG TPA: hypothetical protein ENJ87_12865 [Gammaproteobacteria bacterium]|nr:hypothetical protein [Gammaproteobacteria bacterium]
MEDIKEMRSLVEKAKREEVKAFNEMTSDEETAREQQMQLDTCITYREECLSGMKNAGQSGLSVVQVRECQLLVKYLDSVVETRQYKADISNDSFEKSEKAWKKKNEHYINLKEQLKQREIEERERRENQMVGGEDSTSAAAEKKKAFNK